MDPHPSHADGRTPLERRTQWAALAAAPIVVTLGVIAAIASPGSVSGEADPTLGGLAFGVGAFAVVTALPQLLFGLGLRSGTAGSLTATAVAAPIWALWFGFLPIVSALVGGWDDLAPVAVLTAAAAGVLDVVVLVAARRGLRRLRRRRHRPARDDEAAQA